jgi:hypothetical protein
MARRSSQPERAPLGRAARSTARSSRSPGCPGQANEAADLDAALYGNGQVYAGTNNACDPLTKGTDFQGGHITLTTGQAETGWVPFIVPDGVRITAVSWTPGWGSGGTSATWAVQRS